MIRELTRYGAPAAKARALYGKCLAAEDFRTLAAMKSVPDVTAYLKSHPGWRDSLAGLDPSEVHRNQLEDALRQGMLNEHFRIYNFMAASGVEIYQQPIWRAEQDEILSCFSYISTDRAGGYAPKLSSIYWKYSKVDFFALTGCRDWGSLLSAVSKSDFYPTLSSLRIPESGSPDVASVEWVMQSYVFSRMFSIARRRASGKVRGELESLAGAQVDLINISRVMRIRRFFREAWQDYVHLLLPFYGKVSASLFRELYAAPDEAAASQMLLRTPYRKLFEKTGFRYIEEYYYEYLYEFSQRMFRAHIPSAFSVIAYLNLKEIEVQNIIKTTECIRYGKTPESAGVFLVGVSGLSLEKGR
jgi:V/A-type H+-transporting ATPase subunit C